MPNYEDLGLTSNFQSKNSLAQRGDRIRGIDFDLREDRDIINESKIGSGVIRNVNIGTAVIGTANIGTLSFNEISGGTATLGGTINGNGVLSVKNQAGSEVVKLDNTGITINNGSIVINNASGSSVVDSGGIVSTNTFLNNSVDSSGTTFSTTSLTYVDVTNMTLTFVLSRTTNVLFGLSCAGGNDGTSGGESAIAILDLNGTAVGNQVNTPTVFNGGISLQTSGAVMTIQSVASGTSTVKMRVKALSGGTASYANKSMFYLMLGS